MRGTYDVQLLAYAMKALEDAQASIIPLEKQIQDAERSKRKAAAELELARMAQTRFDAFGQERDRIAQPATLSVKFARRWRASAIIASSA